MKPQLKLGLTGGIGSGKSTVGNMLVGLGATLVDADAISRAMTQPGGAGIEPIREVFGDTFIDASGALDRARMREAIFTDPTAKRRLEAILHPLISAETTRQGQQASTEVVVFDIPLLVEGGRWNKLLDRIIVVDCDVNTQVERVMQRSGWTREAVERVIKLQATRAQRLAIADYVILNEGVGLDELEADVTHAFLTLRADWRRSAFPLA
jgi:dephospho-CoA kinase